MFLTACRTAQTGEKASDNALPPALSGSFVPQTILGKGAFGCVVKAKIKGSEKYAAIKLIVPEKGAFDEREMRQIQREHSVLEMFTHVASDHAVGLTGLHPAHLDSHICWFVMDLIDGDNMEIICKRDPVSYQECIKATRSVLAALKTMHAEGVIHRDIKPSNVVRCASKRPGQLDHDDCNFDYKLIDFGSALGVDEALAKKDMMTMTGNRDIGMGTPPYMSPEMYKEPSKASYPTDLWSLGVTMFEIATGKLPFTAENDLLWNFSIAGNMDEKAPSVLDTLEEGRRAAFDRNLACVISKALEKRVDNR
jgi:serine/threonine protein kinase